MLVARDWEWRESLFRSLPTFQALHRYLLAPRGSRLRPLAATKRVALWLAWPPAIVRPSRCVSAFLPEKWPRRSSTPRAARGRRSPRIANIPRAFGRPRHHRADETPPNRRTNAPRRCLPNGRERLSLWRGNLSTAIPEMHLH